MNELVNFHLCLSANYKKSAPCFCVLHNDSIIVNDKLVQDKTEVSFSLDLPIDKSLDHNIKIKRTNFDGINEQLLNLESITADGINLKKLCYNSKFYPEYPEPWATQQIENGQILPTYHKGWMEWGWNGTWILHFQTPFYTWMLDNV